MAAKNTHRPEPYNQKNRASQLGLVFDKHRFFTTKDNIERQENETQ